MLLDGCAAQRLLDTITVPSQRKENKHELLTEVRLAHSARQVRAAGDVVEVLRLHFLLVGLTVVEVIEVGHDDRNRQCDGEHTGNGAQGSDDFSPDANRPIP